MKMITAARITAMPERMFDPLPVVYVTVNGQEQRLFDYYPDEISFSVGDFIGLTVEQARALKFKRDVNYLRT